eukprot:TRINITY_DN33258_c0_g1_i1.p1 TRINITY_DN33258_c0_g1~~TRINITY_DN33258_c0_g1_i1.p1  ORF type:complete len:372 (-),score=81.72 TRINITY_DN33258_c0_g1_i1:69-1139(-)
MDDESQRWYSDRMLNVAGCRVVVTGAGGRTGRIVLRKLLEMGFDPKCDIIPRAMVRSAESEKSLRDFLGPAAGGMYSCLEVVHGDVTKPETLGPVFKEAKVAVIVTSAMPKLDRSSLITVIGVKVLSLGFASTKPSFWFEEGESPEEVDWIGQKNQIDAARAAGVEHIILVSSMAGTQPDHFLNAKMSNMILWKRKAEEYLMKSGVQYTIIHAGGLLPHFGNADEQAPGGKRQLYLGLDDILLDDGKMHKLVPREDLAEICVQSVLAPEARGRSFDLGSGPEGEGEVYDGNFNRLLATLGDKNCSYDEAALAKQLKLPTESRLLCCTGAAKANNGDVDAADVKATPVLSDNALAGA